MTMIDVSHVTMQFNMANDKIISLKRNCSCFIKRKIKIQEIYGIG